MACMLILQTLQHTDTAEQTLRNERQASWSLQVV